MAENYNDENVEYENYMKKLIGQQKSRLDFSVISEFMPWLIKGFEHFYGKDNIDFIEERMKKIYNKINKPIE